MINSKMWLKNNPSVPNASKLSNKIMIMLLLNLLALPPSPFYPVGEI